MKNKIADLNDKLRSTFAGGRVVMTAAVNELPPDVKARVILAVQSFSKFDTDNDPHHEHDFGSFEIDGEKFFSRSIIIRATWRAARKTRATQRRRRACSPSCSRRIIDARESAPLNMRGGFFKSGWWMGR